MTPANASIIHKGAADRSSPIAYGVINRRCCKGDTEQRLRIRGRIILVGAGKAVRNGVLICSPVVHLDVALVHVEGFGNDVDCVVFQVVVDGCGIERGRKQIARYRADHTVCRRTRLRRSQCDTADLVKGKGLASSGCRAGCATEPSTGRARVIQLFVRTGS